MKARRAVTREKYSQIFIELKKAFFSNPSKEITIDFSIYAQSYQLNAGFGKILRESGIVKFIGKSVYRWEFQGEHEELLDIYFDKSDEKDIQSKDRVKELSELRTTKQAKEKLDLFQSQSIGQYLTATGQLPPVLNFKELSVPVVSTLPKPELLNQMDVLILKLALPEAAKLNPILSEPIDLLMQKIHRMVL